MVEERREWTVSSKTVEVGEVFTDSVREFWREEAIREEVTGETAVEVI